MNDSLLSSVNRREESPMWKLGMMLCVSIGK
mgnify:FL=1